MSYQLVTPATVLPVGVQQAKDQLRITADDEDARLQSLLWRAARHVEAQTGYALTAATWKLWLDDFPGGAGVLELRKPPVSAVAAVRYYDEANVLRTLAASAYDADLVGKPARLKPVDGTNWPAAYRRLNCVEVQFTAGAAAAANVPEPAVQLILLLVEQWYETDPDKGRSLFYAAAQGTIESLLNDLRWASHA